MPRRIESLMITGPAGRLESLLEEPEESNPTFAALVCHPHPQHGGTMHNKVVYRLARGLRRAGAVVLRFNYRSVNLSEGVYDHGVGEEMDARACLAVLRARYPDLPYFVAGFSFGSRIALRISRDSGPSKVIAVGFPTVYKDTSYLQSPYVTPRVFIHSTNDEFGPRPAFEDVMKSLQPSPEVHWVESKDHFFVDALDALEEVVFQVGSKG